MSKPEFLLWCDLETTGLNPESDSILEMALVMTDSELKEIDRKHYIFSAYINFSTINHNVKEMHEKNGLWLDVIKYGNRNDVTWEVTGWIDSLITPSGQPNMMPERFRKVYLAGSSVHFDKRFLDAKKFYFHRDFSHRIFDVSVLRTALKMWHPELLWKQSDTHRALDDILDHIEEAKYYRKVLGLAPES